MIRKFVCENCKQTFEADDSEFVICPHCKSDNVEYYRYRLPRWVPWSILVCIAMAIAVVWVLNLPKKTVRPETNIIMRDSAEQEQVIKADSNYTRDGSTIAPSLSIAEIEYNESDQTYRCLIAVAYAPQQPSKVVISTTSGQIVAESDDGRFEKIPYSKDDGIYSISLREKSSNASLCEERDFPNFPKLDVVKKPWSESELQTALNSGEPQLVDIPYIANPHKVVVVNKPKGDTSLTKSLRDIQMLIQSCSLSCNVEKVEYDHMGKISYAEIRIDYPANWLAEDDDF